MAGYLITQAHLVNEGTVRTVDVRIRGERIATIAPQLSHDGVETLIDGRGLHLLPGVIDTQVHFREPGLTHKGDLHSESRAAVAGGVTSFFEMPNTNPPTLDAQALEDKYARAAHSALANHAFYLGTSIENLEAVKSLDPRAACAIKIFMGASTGNMLVDDPEVLDAIFACAPITVVTHCEHTPTINANLALAQSRFPAGIPIEQHPLIRSREACLASSRLAVELRARHNADLHILHLTTRDEMALFSAGPVAGKRLTGEACIHHLWFSDADYARLGTRLQCNPAVKGALDRAALRQAVIDGRLDLIATDHAPHLLSEKARPYPASAAGLPLVQDFLPALLELVHEGVFSLELAVAKTSHAPAQRFAISERGYVREGYYADLVLVNLYAPYLVRDDEARARCGWTPFAGQRFRSRVEATFVSGHLAYRQGVIDDSRMGLRIGFDRPRG